MSSPVANPGRGRWGFAYFEGHLVMVIIDAGQKSGTRSLWFRRAIVTAMLVLGLTVLLLGVAKFRYGGGLPYPDVSTTPLVSNSGLQKLVTLDFPPGNVAIASNGRIFFNYHPFAKAERFGVATVFELKGDKAQPYPDEAAQSRFQGVFGMTADRQNRLWFIEPAGLDHERTRLLAYDLATNQKVFEHWFPKGVLPFAQDLRVTPDGQTVILADTGLFQFTKPVLAVFNIAGKTLRQYLSEHPALRPQNWVIRTPFGPHRLGYGLVTFSVGIDGIEISPDGEWLYFGAMSHDTLYRLPVAALREVTTNDAELASRIEAVGKKPLSDGITLDLEGRVLITDIENGGIARLESGGRLVTLVKSQAVVWADGVVQAPDGSIVFTDSAIPAYIDQLAAPPSVQRIRAGGPYHLYRFRAP